MATSSVPFIGFGFMDNSIMILAGEVIEVHPLLASLLSCTASLTPFSIHTSGSSA
jgi:hypothetical protein